MDEYQKGYSDAQHLIAQKFVQQVLTEYPLSIEWERVASVTGLTKEEVIAAIKEGKEEDAGQLLQECLTESASLDEKIVRMLLEGFTPFFICKTFGISQSRIDLVMERPELAVRMYANGMSVHTISQLLDLPEEDVQKKVWGLSQV